MASPFNIPNKTYTPAEAQALLARLVANPIPATNASVKGATGFRNVVSGVQRVPGKPGYHVEDPRVEDQSASPAKPETRYASASTYGKVIPISLGKRRLEGNLIQSSSITPRLVGSRTITIEYDVPIYEDPPVDEEAGFKTVNINPIPNDECDPYDFLDNNPPSCSSSNTENGETAECGKKDGCATRASAPSGGGSSQEYTIRDKTCAGPITDCEDGQLHETYTSLASAMVAFNALTDSNPPGEAYIICDSNGTIIQSYTGWMGLC